MPTTVQEFISDMTEKIAGDLEKALLALPKDQRSWLPLDKGRSALDQVAECALMNKYAVLMLKTYALSDETMAAWSQDHAALAVDTDTVLTALKANTETLLLAIQALPDSAMDIEVKLPWETTTIAKIMVFPYWNMAYHEGQINYISTLL